MKSPWKQHRDITGHFRLSHNSQLRSLSQSTKPSCCSSKATFIDLFAGIGGFHYALAGNGVVCVYANENNAKAADTYERNHCRNRNGYGNEGISSVDRRDIREVVSGHMRDIPDHAILTGGFACQPYSMAGKLMGPNCPKHGDHLEQIGKIVAAKRPAIVLLENVKNFASARFNGAEKAGHMFDALGYRPSHRIYNASDFNLPQNRERIFIVAVRKDVASAPFEMPEPPGRRDGLCLEDYCLTLEEMQSPDTLVSKRPKHLEVVKRAKWLRAPVRKTSNRTLQLDWTDVRAALPSPTLKGLIHVARWVSPDGSVYMSDIVLHPRGFARCLTTAQKCWYLMPDLDSDLDGRFVVRELYPREMARIQGFPESLILPKFKCVAQEQLGNAVPPPVVDCIVKALMKQYPGVFLGAYNSRPVLAKL